MPSARVDNPAGSGLAGWHVRTSKGRSLAWQTGDLEFHAPDEPGAFSPRPRKGPYLDAGRPRQPSSRWGEFGMRLGMNEGPRVRLKRYNLGQQPCDVGRRVEDLNH